MRIALRQTGLDRQRGTAGDLRITDAKFAGCISNQALVADVAGRMGGHSQLRKEQRENQQKGMQTSFHRCILASAAQRCHHMPELPEVETTRRGLEPRLQGKILRAIKVRDKRLRWPIPDDIDTRLADRRVRSISRRGKYLLFDFDGLCQIVHLGMSGSLRFADENEPAAAHDHVDWVFEDGTMLRLRDPRRFGAVLLTADPKHHPLLAHLGPEPLTRTFDGKRLYDATRGRKTSIKNLIMDSRTVVGVGNIYASESLFAAGIRPGRAAGRLTRGECDRLAAAIKATLRSAVNAGGSSLRDYVAADGELGYFQLHTKVYDRAGLPCKICGTPIKKLAKGQRSTFYCPKCQK